MARAGLAGWFVRMTCVPPHALDVLSTRPGPRRHRIHQPRTRTEPVSPPGTRPDIDLSRYVESALGYRESPTVPRTYRHPISFPHPCAERGRDPRCYRAVTAQRMRTAGPPHGPL